LSWVFSEEQHEAESYIFHPFTLSKEMAGCKDKKRRCGGAVVHPGRRAKFGLYPRSFSAKLINVMHSSPTPEKLAAEAWEALARRPPRAPLERFQELVRLGWINARGQVTTFLGGVVEPEPDYQTWTADRDAPQKNKKTAKRARAKKVVKEKSDLNGS
jgi:hypothetical protein